MAGIGKFSLSMLSGVQETTATLAQINFDFSMIKMEAPLEFRPLGQALSRKRKHNAEDGEAHITARRLGALFAKEIPDISHLAHAYGLRVSEISQDPKVNPQGRDADGALAAYVGADGTSIWAAATSGKGALGVHLLTCMLARIWSGPEATSIWSELVEARKLALQHECQGQEFSLETVTAAQITLTRDNLAEWDASARSWLRTADRAKQLQQTQLMLMIDRNELSLESSQDLYFNVIKTWKTALTTVNNLVAGIPQSVQRGEILLGLSSWHLYPDMSVISHEFKSIQQNDSLIQDSGTLTIGQTLSNAGQSTGVTWSLPLGQLRYHSRKPVHSSRSIGSRNSKVSFNNFILITLGGAMSQWGQAAENFHDVAKFLIALYKCLNGGDPSFSNNAIDPERESIVRGWVKLFADQARYYLDATDTTKHEMVRYITLGRRRYGSLLDVIHPNPMFGLCFLPDFLQLLDVEDRINTLRGIAESGTINIDLSIAFICYEPGMNRPPELATLFPCANPQSAEMIHHRWVYGPLHSASKRSGDSIDLNGRWSHGDDSDSDESFEFRPERSSKHPIDLDELGTEYDYFVRPWNIVNYHHETWGQRFQ